MFVRESNKLNQHCIGGAMDVDRVGLKTHFRAVGGPTTRAQDATLQEPKLRPKILSSYAAVYNTFYVQRHLGSARTHRTLRAAALDTWREAVVAA
jgi:hypothetical protein